jgi:hypothetical protein
VYAGETKEFPKGRPGSPSISRRSPITSGRRAARPAAPATSTAAAATRQARRPGHLHGQPAPRGRHPHGRPEEDELPGLPPGQGPLH